jgi:lipopolysaccharide transport protein LptA
MAALVALGAALAAAPRAGAQTEQTPTREQRQLGDLTITAGTFDYDLDLRQVVAEGNVVLEYGTSHVRSDKMTAQMMPNRTLDWAKCEGNVQVDKQDPEQKTAIAGRGHVLDYYERQQKAILMGKGDDGVEVQFTSPRLEKPALMTGLRVEMDLRTQENVVHRSSKAQAHAHLDPRPTPGKPLPEPVDFYADRLEMDGAKHIYSGSGNPVLVRPSAKLRARKIVIEMEETGTDLKSARAEENVVFDGKSARGSLIHTTADKGVYTYTGKELVLTGSVVALITEPGEDKPEVLKGSTFVFNTETRLAKLSGGASVVLPPKAQAPGPAGGKVDEGKANKDGKSEGKNGKSEGKNGKSEGKSDQAGT